jgi:hypothetical protein
MSNLMRVPCTSISPRSDRGRHLTGSVVPVGMVGLTDRREMYALLRTYFSGTTRARFEADLREKEHVILLRDAGTGRIQGFSTFMRIEMPIDDTNVLAFFSGDTIVDREYWGETILSRIWGQTIVSEAERVHMTQPHTTVYWFLICSGYKTWRFLPVFFREFYPNPDVPTPPRVRRLIDTLGTTRFGDEYVPEAGVVRFRHATPLRHGVADLTDERLRDPRIAFFARMNPGHADGDELACLAELSRANLTRAGLRMVSPCSDRPAPLP